MLPPPPGLFSTTAVWLRLACRPDAISRATTSLEPPGVNGTMMRSVLLGNPRAGAVGCCARAASGDQADSRGTGEQRHELAAFHSITSLARAGSIGATCTASARADKCMFRADWQDWQSLQVRAGTAAHRRGQRSSACGCSLAQKIEHRGLGQHRLRNAVALGAGALLGGLRRPADRRRDGGRAR